MAQPEVVSVRISLKDIEEDKRVVLEKWLLARAKKYGVTISKANGKTFAIYAKTLPKKVADDLRVKTNALAIKTLN